MTTDLTSPRRGRPRTVATSSGLDPAEEILRHAAQLFSANGLGATKISEVAEAVGVKPPAIYYHFANLDAIVEHLLRYVVEESAAFATRTAASEGTSTDRLSALVAQHVQRLTDTPYDLWFVAGMSDANSERFPEARRHAKQWRRAVATLFEQGRAAGEFREIDTVVALSVVSGMVYGALEAHHRVGSTDPHQIADMTVAALAVKHER